MSLCLISIVAPYLLRTIQDTYRTATVAVIGFFAKKVANVNSTFARNYKL